MGRIVSIGECMGELSETGTPGTLNMGFAGDTLNTAYYLRHSLGPDWQVDYVTAIGTDGLSQRMLDFLKAEDIATHHIAQLADKTIGLYYITLKDGERSFTYWRSDSAAKKCRSAPPSRRQASTCTPACSSTAGQTLPNRSRSWPNTSEGTATASAQASG
mgnify:CR=1 FL=1